MEPVNVESTEIESKIIDAANFMFLKHGISNATMTQIAEKAGISRTSLNYYFRSKKHLLKKVISNLEHKIIPAFSVLINDENTSILIKAEHFINEYIDLAAKYPMVPAFILNEIGRDPNWVISFFKQRDINYDKFESQIQKEIAEGQLAEFNPIDLFVNIFGLCVFPIISKPLLMAFYFKSNDEYNQYLSDRKKVVNKVIYNWISKN